MKYLLDSHTFLWWVLDAPQLSPRARGIVADETNDILISAVTIYELLFKAGRDRLPLAPDKLKQAIDACGFPVVPVTRDHCEAAALFDWEHGDPWDRILAVQTLAESCILVSVDEAFDAIDLQRVW